MSQAPDYSLSNQPGASFRAEVNTIFGAVKTCNSGPTPPANPEPGMPWLDTSINVYFRRNLANTDWVPVGAETGGIFRPYSYGFELLAQDLLANIPAAGNTGRTFLATDTREIYRDNGTNWDLLSGPIAPPWTIVTASGTYNKPLGLKSLDAWCVGGGGGGGGGTTNVLGGGGGGGGGAGYRRIDEALIGATETMTIGAGGAGGTPGTPGTSGGTTSFGALLVATGGAGAPANGSGGAGGVGMAGDLNAYGDGGGAGDVAFTNLLFSGRGGGAAGPWGSGGTEGTYEGNTLAPVAGRSFGGGGGGGNDIGSGAAGAPGVILYRENF